ncbi:E3 ubiquitin-protein ligase PUB23-like [Punica granatum]|uniref:U-box domain-containing protein n=1 Tax=Punica granatum TaxID=22663 RepID=A0A218W843_PUNGR|nr:E3 ubiquitin-protein ligase PUB23-like [Punica granatum]OWM69044.1 hypothetical protein CDL15_Pgr025231 [Punica granatum]
MDEAVEIPSHFLCPISLQLMRDPVTVSTGITYDRESIERWLYSCKNGTCPVTKQLLSDADPITPNHTLRRLIQGWCTLNASQGIERIPTPKAPIDRAQIAKILTDGRKHAHMRLACLQQLRSIASGSERSRKILATTESGVMEFLVSIIISDHESTSVIDEALHVLHNLDISESNIKNLMKSGSRDELVSALVRVMKTSTNYQSRAHAIITLRSIFKIADPMQLINIEHEFFQELVRVLSDQISQQASKATLKLLVELCPWGRNRIKAVEGGAVPVLIELLLSINNNSPDNRRSCELILIVLDQLSGCADGREELLKHGAGLAIVSKKILRVSHVASDRAVRVLSSVSRFSANSRVLQEMLQVGVVSKLCLVLQVESSPKTKDRAREILKLHSRVWRNSPCIPSHLLSSYPSNSSS